MSLLKRLLSYLARFRHCREVSCNDKFICPECGGNYFGTVNSSLPVKEWTRHCNSFYTFGGEYRRCDFKWPKADDCYYFVPRR